MRFCYQFFFPEQLGIWFLSKVRFKFAEIFTVFKRLPVTFSADIRESLSHLTLIWIAIKKCVAVRLGVIYDSQPTNR
jgi:hypothetical protein